MPDPAIPLAEYAARRKKVCTALQKSVGIVFAGDHDPHLDSAFRPHPHFEYLTGVTDEPGAALVLDPGAPSAGRREMLFLRPLNPEVEKWDGYRQEIGQALREDVGIKAVYRTTHLPRFLTDAAHRSRRLACLHPVAWYDQPVSPDLALFRKIAERIPDVTIADATDLLPKLRSVKSKHEIAMIERAVEITAAGFDAVLTGLAPGLGEFDVQTRLEHAYRISGSRGPAYGSIVGGGLNATVLHYRANDAPIGTDDLVCIDSGAAFGGYGADITRTLPASGRFTDRQREVYEIVLAALEAAIEAVEPGATMAQIDAVARAVITKAGFGDAFIHSIGHHLGLETHDAAPAGPLQKGAVVTIEPGIYLPGERIGVRIEDDVVVTANGARNLSAAIPRTVEDIERRMRPG